MTKRASRAAWCAALLVLAAALFYFNLPPAQIAPEQSDPGAPLGCRPGEQLPDFSLLQTDGQTFTLSEHRGKTVVINLWATWCAPCVKELPYFDALQRANPDQVKVLALHASLITDDPVAYLAGSDYQMAFAVDPDGEIYAALGGSALLPQTLMISPQGVVTYNQPGSVTPEALEELTAAALAAAR